MTAYNLFRSAPKRDAGYTCTAAVGVTSRNHVAGMCHASVPSNIIACPCWGTILGIVDAVVSAIVVSIFNVVATQTKRTSFRIYVEDEREGGSTHQRRSANSLSMKHAQKGLRVGQHGHGILYIFVWYRYIYFLFAINACMGCRPRFS